MRRLKKVITIFKEIRKTKYTTITLRPLCLMSTPDQKRKKKKNYLNSGLWVAQKGRSGYREPRWIKFE